MVQATPARRCDIVMKGGVTSGIVYPSAVRVLAESFCFVNIGGTSAGAIAATLTAAAEYRRQTGGGLAGFDRLADIPGELAKNGALFGLFRPNRSTKGLLDAVIALSASRSAAGAIARLLFGSFRGPAWFFAWGGLLVGVVLAIILFALVPQWATLLGAVALAVLGGLIGTVLALWRTAVWAQHIFVANGYGLSTGLDERKPTDTTVLSAWLGKMLDEIAGLPKGEHLTFGHLWYGRKPAPADGHHRPNQPVINLEVVSTCLSHGRPYTFPTSSDVFYFKPEVLRRYLEPSVVEAMEGAARPPSDAKAPSAQELLPYVRMPYDRDLPVVLAARMSLAFPGLLSAVELGAVAYGEVRDPQAPPPKPEPCWFADGGLSSNFPIHLFDSPLPRWPTVGINLGTFSDDEERTYDARDHQSKYVWMPAENSAGMQEQWSRFSDVKAYFGGAMLGAIKDWNDNVQMKVPGFRDRIATVKLRASEGGLNLKMDREKIDALVARGRAAGELLTKRFARVSDGSFSEPMDWDNHRWVRFRVFAGTAETYLQQIERGYAGAQPGDCSYEELLRLSENRTRGAPYPWRDLTTGRNSRDLTRAAAGYASWLRQNKIAFGHGAPHPQPDLSKRPRF
jgi:predicted acylesterase/phospholipase RssA